MKSFFQLSFVPASAGCALFIIRVWFGLTMLLNHGWSKLANYSAAKGHIPNPLHLPVDVNMALAVICEVLCPVLMILGLATRLAALLLALEMAIAFFMIHQHQLSGPHSGELAFLYLAAAVAVLVGGAGCAAVDKS